MAYYFSTRHSGQISRTSLHNSLDAIILLLAECVILIVYESNILTVMLLSQLQWQRGTVMMYLASGSHLLGASITTYSFFVGWKQK